MSIRKGPKLGSTGSLILAHKDLYLIVLPAIAILLVFRYLPMWGAQIAFRDYTLSEGIVGSEWVGLKHFSTLFASERFFEVLRNTLLINLYKVLFHWPLGVFLAILLNEVRIVAFKRTAQTLTYLPHFLSWVIVGAIFVDILAPGQGIINRILVRLGIEPIFFLADSRFFRPVVVVSAIYKEVGWNSIVYLAAMQGIDPQLYEAIQIDGGGRLRRIWHITLPGIRSTVVFILMLRLGSAIKTDVEHILMLLNPLVYNVGDVIGTYVYRIGLGQLRFSFTTALGLFQSAIGFILLLTANTIARRFGERGVF